MAPGFLPVIRRGSSRSFIAGAMKAMPGARDSDSPFAAPSSTPTVDKFPRLDVQAAALDSPLRCRLPDARNKPHADSANPCAVRCNSFGGDRGLLLALSLASQRRVDLAADSVSGKPGMFRLAVIAASCCRGARLCGLRRSLCGDGTSLALEG